jgi:phosphoribosyl 1,2-cyclic phosphodiesterase
MRIAGDLGHLSNDNASEFASYLAEKGTKIIVLGHLSHENNTPTLAYDTLCSKLRDRGFENGKEVSVYVAKRDVPMKMIHIED